MAEAADRLEALVAQVGVVRAEHLRRAHHLVDAGRRRERGDVDAEPLLELDQQVEEDAVAARGVGDEAGELPEVRLLLARGRAERGRVDRRRSARRGCGSRPGRAARGRRAGSCSRSCGALDEDVGDGEGVVEGRARGRGRRRGPPRPRSCAGCRAAGRSRRPRRRRCRRGGASSAGPGSPARSARGSASRPCGPRRRSRRRPCPRRWAARRAAGRRARASSADARASSRDWVLRHADLPVSAPSSSGRATG